ncbi:MAG: hypothetical protein JWO38_4419 [Gemmataceae bacterium]|nr:hypothetical protein [Gemmataceae bacterium]
MDVVKDTAEYEAWLGGICPLVPADLEYKHRQMVDPVNPFPYFRGTYYRWVRLWPAACPDMIDAPRVLAVGDLHLENFGTWRDEDGRLCWGVNDFDEVDELPYTNDLVRLAASARFAKKAGNLDIKLGAACEAILAGYRGCLEAGGRPFVLEEHHPHLRAAAMAAERDPPHFWAKLTALLKDTPVDPPAEARAVLTQALPAEGLNPSFRTRPRAGVGSLGRPRYVALVEWRGGWVCREAKAAAPSATARVAGVTDPAANRMAEAVARAVRCPDPFYRPGPRWVVRRLAPRCSRVELTHLAAADAERVLQGMGAETANVHLGTPQAGEKIRRDLDRRPAGWLEPAARAAADAVENDWAEWRRAAR